MSYENQGSINRDVQYAAELPDAFIEFVEGRLKNLHTAMPGIIQSFDADKQTCTVQPAIRRIWVEKGPLNIPLCVDVPVAFPGGGDLYLTFPVKAGDECVLIVCERVIDDWMMDGGVVTPQEYRLHEPSDAIAFVGVNSQPRKLPNLNTSGAELRTRDGETYIRVESGTITIKGNIVIDGDTTQTGKITASDDVVGNGTSLHTHKHGGVQAGGSQTGVPL